MLQKKIGTTSRSSCNTEKNEGVNFNELRTMNNFRKRLPNKQGRFCFKRKRALGKQNCKFCVIN